MSDLIQLGFSKTLGMMLVGVLLAAPVVPTIIAPAAAQSEVEASAADTRFVVLETPAPSADKLDIFVMRSTDNGDSWEEPENLSANAGHSHGSWILKSGSNVYVVWVQENSDGTKSDVYFRGSENDGQSWGPRIKLSSTGTAFDSTALIGASGSNVYVMWDDSGKGDVYLRRSTNNGDTWVSIVNLSSNPGKSDSPDLSVSGSNVYTVWAQANSGGSATDVFIRVSNDGGATWESRTNLSTSGKAVGPSVASSGSRAHVAWQDASAGNGDILFRTSSNEGEDWGSSKNLSSDSARSLDPELAASGSSVYLEYTKRTSTQDYSIIFRSSTNNGATWAGKTTLATNHFFGIGPAAIHTSGSNVHVAIEIPEQDDTLLRLRSSTNNGGSFGPLVDPTSQDAASRPDVAVSGSDVFAVWLGGALSDDGFFVVTFARSEDNGETWSNPIKLHDPGPRSLRIA